MIFNLGRFPISQSRLTAVAMAGVAFVSASTTSSSAQAKAGRTTASASGEYLCGPVIVLEILAGGQIQLDGGDYAVNYAPTATGSSTFNVVKAVMGNAPAKSIELEALRGSYSLTIGGQTYTCTKNHGDT